MRGIKIHRFFLALALSLVSICAFPHSGGVDSNGGHNDRTNGGYHCHKEPCLSSHRSSDKALSEAHEEGRELSYIYRRDDWKHWSDIDNDCMDMRHEILLAQSDGPNILSADRCEVLRGMWRDPFSGKQITVARKLDVDHIVPLKWASDHGAAVWSLKKKERFANDPINLLAVDSGLNRSKGAKGPSEWMPPNHSFRCDYLGLWKKVLREYPSLSMTKKENRVYMRQLDACGR